MRPALLNRELMTSGTKIEQSFKRSPYGDWHREHANSYVPLQQMDDGLGVPAIFLGTSKICLRSK